MLCALGLAAAAPRHDVSRTVMLAGETLTPERVDAERGALLAEARRALARAPSRLRVTHELRYRGQSFELSIEESEQVDPASLREAFARAHESRYGYRDDDAEIELVNVRASVWGDAPPLRPLAAGGESASTGTAPIVFDGAAVTASVVRGEIAPGTHLNGPALYALPDSTLLLPPGWSGTVDANGTCRLQAGTDG